MNVCIAFLSSPSQNRLWYLFARHTTMTLIILYLVYTQVSTVVSSLLLCSTRDNLVCSPPD